MSKITLKSDIIVSSLVHYLSDTDQLALLPQVRESLDALVSKTKKAEEILVTSPIALTSAQQRQIQKFVFHAFHERLPLVNNIDRHLIGGFTLRVGDWFMDASLLYQLANLRKTLLA